MKQMSKKNKHNKIKLIFFDCNVPLSNWDKFLYKKYLNDLSYFLYSSCQKKKGDKIKKELSNSIADDLDFYDFFD